MTLPADADRAEDFVIASPDGHLCPACGFAGWFDGRHYMRGYGGLAGTGICPCCLFEPGFDDVEGMTAQAGLSILDSVIAYRGEWAAGGSRWLSDSVPQPRGWSAAAQLERLFRLAPFLRGEAGAKPFCFRGKAPELPP